MKNKVKIIAVFLGILFLGIFLRLGWSSRFFAFAGIFKTNDTESKLRMKIVALEEALARSSGANDLSAASNGETEILGYLIGSGGRKVFLGQGSKDGVVPGDWVVAGDRTLFGVVERADKDYSLVKTVFDPSLKVASRIRAYAINPASASSSAVYGGVFYFDGKNFVVDFLPKDVDLFSESFAESSGKDGVFRSGFYLGRVVAEPENSSEANLKKISIESPLKLDEIYQVKILKNFLRQ